MWHKVKQLDKKTISSISRGETAQLIVELEAIKRGIMVSRSYLPLRYDIILDYDGKLYKTQIKYCDAKSSIKNKNRLELRLDNNGHGKKYYTEEQIDLLLVFCPVIDKILAYSPAEFHNKKIIYIQLKNEKSKHFWEKHIW